MPQTGAEEGYSLMRLVCFFPVSQLSTTSFGPVRLVLAPQKTIRQWSRSFPFWDPACGLQSSQRPEQPGCPFSNGPKERISGLACGDHTLCTAPRRVFYGLEEPSIFFPSRGILIEAWTSLRSAFTWTWSWCDFWLPIVSRPQPRLWPHSGLVKATKTVGLIELDHGNSASTTSDGVGMKSRHQSPVTSQVFKTASPPHLACLPILHLHLCNPPTTHTLL
jgi:hypothetical protein